MVWTRLCRYPATIAVLSLMVVIYAGQLFIAGSLQDDTAYTVANSLSTGVYVALTPWLHSSHKHILENAGIFIILGLWTERRVGSIPFLGIVLFAGYLTNLAPAILGFGGPGLGASGITNALWAYFTGVQIVKYQQVIQRESQPIRHAIQPLVLSFVGLLFVIRSIAEFTGYISPPSGTATGAHFLGVVLGFGWLAYRSIRISSSF